ncbi:MAG: type II toxin-antitoxin system PemK/MazF family toxin [Chloroflexi bacterium]|nr:type II toxin-antitoxin system PemK/MazF family toxin [Chloroflexota bacterium]
MKRGEVWWAKLDPPTGQRPVVLLSRNDAYTARSLVIVAPVTTRIRHIHSEVLLDTDNGMPRECVINLDTITTIPKDCLKYRIITLTREKLRQVEASTHFALGMDE